MKYLETGKILMLDSDMLIFKIASRNEFVLDFENNKVLGLYKYDENNPNHIIINTLDTAIEEFREVHNTLQENTKMFVVHCLSSKNNFRKNFFPEYKSNRTQRRPSILKDLRDNIYKSFNYLEKDTLEADDLLGINGYNNSNVYIASGDKDMKQINCNQYNWETNEFFYIDKESSLKFFYKQVLIGDPVDGYKGLIGIGDKKADKILEKAEEHYINYCNKIEDNTQKKRVLESFYLEHIINEYLAKKNTLEYLNIQMVMAKILTEDKINTNLLFDKIKEFKITLNSNDTQ